MGNDQFVLALEVRLKFSNLRGRFSIGDCRVAKRRIGALEIVGTRAALHWLAAPGCTWLHFNAGNSLGVIFLLFPWHMHRVGMSAAGESNNAVWIEVCRVVAAVRVFAKCLDFFFLPTKVQAVRATNLISK
jgi:hypothetical protein